ncbi:predicted protein [Naegleria gruberi]|uniref:Predicted protein n=1 Tax=Naegleria gruberi TaxID=5762 RepID=D2VUS8_NAEGR|nr:uncharacterized protein NAEGRDRAFT_72771 [Naegleria gruberi]EFC39309.1 predicted protein [Naegleria gruberi]|eukprot:XP_002672053.1 predicted protein [Naegleria gruberi strain NEG-M]
MNQIEAGLEPSTSSNLGPKGIERLETDFTEIKRITDPSQIRERREKEGKEQERLSKFELSFQLQPFYGNEIPEDHLIQIIVAEYNYSLKKYSIIGTTECMKQIYCENKEERIMLGDYNFVKPISRTFQFGCVQKMKIFIRFVSPKDAKQLTSQSQSFSQSFYKYNNQMGSSHNVLVENDESESSSNLFGIPNQKYELVEESDARIVMESDEFTIADLLMTVPHTGMSTREMMDFRTHARVIQFSKLHNNFIIDKKKSDVSLDSKLPRVIVSLITPAPREHIVERETTESGTQIILKNISEYGEVESKRMSITLRLQIRDAPILDRFSSSCSPYFIVYKDGVKFKQRLYTSEIKKKSPNSTYRVFSFGLEGERSLDKSMLIEWWHFNEFGKNEFIGIVRTDILDMREHQTCEFKIVNPDTPNAFRGTMHVLKYEERIWMIEDVNQKFKSKKTGEMKIQSYRLFKNDFSIMNYLGYYEMRLCFGIDLTSTNGIQPTSNKRSLHYIGATSEERKSPNPLNPYEKCMVGIMRAVYQYGYQREMKMYGFGALAPNVVFEMQEKKRVARESGIRDEKTMLHTYRRTVKKVLLGLENNFTKIIAEVAAFAERLNHYFICVIITDGDEGINRKLTLQLLKQSQLCGVSFVFVGVGNKSLFKNLMSFQTNCRNVTFVKYNDNMELNAMNALREVQQHAREYLAQRKIVPEEY